MADLSIPQKRCTKCGERFPATVEHFHRNSRGLYGLQAQCRACKKLYSHNRNQLPEVKNGNRLRASQWRDAHPGQHAENMRVYREENRDEVNTRNREREAAKPPSERIAYRYKRRHPQRVRESQYKWREKHPDTWRVASKKGQTTRRARKQGAEGAYTLEDVQKQLIVQRELCWWCGEKIKGKYHPDHLIPLSRGGSNYPNNIVVACVSCNLKKYNKMPWEWSGRLL